MRRKNPTRKHPTYQELEKEVAAFQKEVVALREQLLFLQQYREEAKHRIVELEKKLIELGYADAAAKRMSRNTLEGQPLFAGLDEGEEMSTDDGDEDDEESESLRYTRRKKGMGKRGRKGLPAELERKVKEYDVKPAD